MRDARNELVKYGAKTVSAGLVAGAGGNISVRDGNIAWMKPTGLAMDELSPDLLSAVDIKSGRLKSRRIRPTTEIRMHLAIYRARPDVFAVCHTHSPWASGVISAGACLKPMFAEFVVDLGRIAEIPYITPGTARLANAIGAHIRKHDTLFLINHGVLAVGKTMRQAFFRCAVVEDAGKSLVAAAVAGKPRFLGEREIKKLMRLNGAKRRVAVMERGNQL